MHEHSAFTTTFASASTSTSTAAASGTASAVTSSQPHNNQHQHQHHHYHYHYHYQPRREFQQATTPTQTAIPYKNDSTSSSSSSDAIVIHDVWQENLEEKMKLLRELATKYTFVSMDTEFPGIVTRPQGCHLTTKEYHYKTIKSNVNMLRLIQLGLSFSDHDGNRIPDSCTFQFNFKFSITGGDAYSPDSIDLLTRAGIDFERHEKNGIDVNLFGELLITSGLVLSDSIKWIAFHSAFDFAYLLKLVTGRQLPEDEAAFIDVLARFFPRIFDVKCLMRQCPRLKGGLQELASDLNIERVGVQHQAGSDALLTARVFFKLRDSFFNGCLDESRFLNQLFGVGLWVPGVTTASSSNSSTFVSSSSSSCSTTPSAPTPASIHYITK